MTTELCFTGDIMCQMELTRQNDGSVRMTGGSFSIMRSVTRADGVFVVIPLYELIGEENDPEQKEFLAEELRRSVRTFLDLPVDADVALQAGYPLPAGK